MDDRINRRVAAHALGIGALALIAGRRAAAQANAKPLEFGLLPNLSARILLAQYQPLREYLERTLQRPVQVSTAPNWNTFFRRTAALEYDVVVTAANMARVAQLDGGWLPLVNYTPQIKGLVVVAKQRPLRHISELRGQRLALSNPQSLVTLRGMQWLAEQGLKRDVDFATMDTPTDDSVGNLVARGDCVAAMLSGGEFRAIPEEVVSRLQLLLNFADVPSFIVIASPKLPPVQAAAIQRALLGFANGGDEGKAFFAATGFTGMTEVAPTLLAQLDVYAADTRRLFAVP